MLYVEADRIDLIIHNHQDHCNVKDREYIAKNCAPAVTSQRGVKSAIPAHPFRPLRRNELTRPAIGRGFRSHWAPYGTIILLNKELTMYPIGAILLAATLIIGGLGTVYPSLAVSIPLVAWMAVATGVVIVAEALTGDLRRRVSRRRGE